METKLFDILRQKLADCGLTQSAIAKAAGVQQATLSRFLSGGQPVLGGETVARLLNFLGARLAFADDERQRDPDREVCFVNARLAPGSTPAADARAGAPRTPAGSAPAEALAETPGEAPEAGGAAAFPQAEDYVAAPLVGEVGAGPGYIPEEKIKSWFLAYRNLPAIMYRKNLIAVEIGAGSVSMQPTLSPGDIVLVDRDDRDVSTPGRMMLVLDPADGSGMVKRVAVTPREDGDALVTFYSDNVAAYPPSVYSLERDFGGDWERAIAGRVVWAWSDVREK